jgi:hypothetical protein
MNEILAGVPRIRALMITFVVSFLIMLCGACLNPFRLKHGPCIFSNVSAGEGFEVVMEVRFLAREPGRRLVDSKSEPLGFKVHHVHGHKTGCCLALLGGSEGITHRHAFFIFSRLLASN